jgi:hypothetical protein
MVITIPTVGRVSGNNGRWISTTLVYLLASTLAAALFGAVLALLGRPLAAGTDWPGLALVLGGAALAFGLADLGVLALPRPQRHEQVLAGWRARFAPEATAGLYGAMLGVGVLTRIAYASLYVLLTWTLLAGTILGGAIIFGVYGLMRAVPAVLLSPFLRHDEMAYQLTLRLMPWQRPLRRLTGVVLVGMALVVFAQALG